MKYKKMLLILGVFITGISGFISYKNIEKTYCVVYTNVVVDMPL